MHLGKVPLACTSLQHYLFQHLNTGGGAIAKSTACACCEAKIWHTAVTCKGHGLLSAGLVPPELPILVCGIVDPLRNSILLLYY